MQIFAKRWSVVALRTPGKAGEYKPQPLGQQFRKNFAVLLLHWHIRLFYLESLTMYTGD